MLLLEQNSFIFSASAASPYVWTIKTTRVLVVILFFTSSNFIFHDIGLTSQNTGLAPLRITAAKQEIIVKDGIITSSSSCKSSNFRATSSATLPLLRAT